MILYIYCHLLIVIFLQDCSLLILTFNFTNASWTERFSLDDIKGYRVTYLGALKIPLHVIVSKLLKIPGLKIERLLKCGFSLS